MMGSGEEKVFTFAQVSEHNSAKDCWLIIGGKVYDVTEFLDQHPGGKDATDDFEDIGHSASAKEMMGKYYVGKIDYSTVPLKKAYTPQKQPPYNPDKTEEFTVKILQYLAPLLILGLALGIRFYIKST